MQVKSQACPQPGQNGLSQKGNAGENADWGSCCGHQDAGISNRNTATGGTSHPTPGPASNSTELWFYFYLLLHNLQ